MKHEISAALYDYWLSRHHEEAVRASGIRPGELSALLPSLFLIELDSSEHPIFEFRYCGVTIARRYGRDLVGEDFLKLWNPYDRATLQRDLCALAFRSTGMVTGVLAETMAGGVVSYEMLLLPLAGDHRPAGALGSMVRIGGHEESNRLRARIVEQSIRSIRFLPMVGFETLQPHPKAAPSIPIGDLQARRRYGHLTVVTGGK
jgi:hypothetical protein